MFIQNDFQQELSWLNVLNIWCALTNILYQQKHQVFGSKRVFEKDLEKGCMEVDWSKIHFTRARHLHRIWQAQIQNENVPHVIYEDFAFLTTKTETENTFDRLSYPEH